MISTLNIINTRSDLGRARYTARKMIVKKTEKKPRLAQIYLQVCEQTHESELKARTRDAPS